MKRYILSMVGRLEECDTGYLCCYDDVRELENKIKQLEAENELLKEQVEQDDSLSVVYIAGYADAKDKYRQRIAELEAENKAMRNCQNCGNYNKCFYLDNETGWQSEPICSLEERELDEWQPKPEDE